MHKLEKLEGLEVRDTTPKIQEIQEISDDDEVIELKDPINVVYIGEARALRSHSGVDAGVKQGKATQPAPVLHMSTGLASAYQLGMRNLVG